MKIFLVLHCVFSIFEYLLKDRLINSVYTTFFFFFETILLETLTKC